MNWIDTCNFHSKWILMSLRRPTIKITTVSKPVLESKWSRCVQKHPISCKPKNRNSRTKQRKIKKHQQHLNKTSIQAWTSVRCQSHIEISMMRNPRLKFSDFHFLCKTQSDGWYSYDSHVGNPFSKRTMPPR